MDKTGMSVLERAEGFLYSNGRLLERRRFAYHFKDGSKDAVLRSLRAYQNEDGGFGNALEPDKRTPTSQPIDQEEALKILDEVGFDTDIAKDICNFLPTISTDEDGVPFTLPSVRDAPRAPWWHTDEAQAANLNPTASIAGLLHKYSFEHPWLDKATSFCWEKLDALDEAEMHLLRSILLFLENFPDKTRAIQTFEKIQGKIIEYTALDPNAEGYAFSPLVYAPTPQSLARSLYADDVIDAHLDALTQSQQEDGGWNIAWPAVKPACELEYRGIVTLNNLLTLRAYRHL